jgi:hypothetical protein
MNARCHLFTNESLHAVDQPRRARDLQEKPHGGRAHECREQECDDCSAAGRRALERQERFVQSEEDCLYRRRREQQCREHELQRGPRRYDPPRRCAPVLAAEPGDAQQPDETEGALCKEWQVLSSRRCRATCASPGRVRERSGASGFTPAARSSPAPCPRARRPDRSMPSGSDPLRRSFEFSVQRRAPQ